MNILFMHPNFQGQFLYLSRHMAQVDGHRVVFLTKKTNGNRIG